MLFDDSLRKAKRHHRLRGILKELQNRRTDLKSAFRLAQDRATGDVNITRLLKILERIAERRNTDFSEFLDRVAAGKVKSFTDTIKELQDRSNRRLNILSNRLVNGVDSRERFAKNLGAENKSLAGLGAVIGGIGSSLGDAFRRNFRQILQKAKDKTRTILERISDRVSKTPILTVTILNKEVINTNNLFSAASDSAREVPDPIDRIGNDAPNSDDLSDEEREEQRQRRLEEDVINEADTDTLADLSQPAENFKQLILLFGHLRVERRFEIRDNSICPECIKFANMSWQLRGVLPNIGERSRCRSRCRCRFISRTLRQLSRSNALPVLRDVRHRVSLSIDRRNEEEEKAQKAQAKAEQREIKRQEKLEALKKEAKARKKRLGSKRLFDSKVLSSKFKKNQAEERELKEVNRQNAKQERERKRLEREAEAERAKAEREAKKEQKRLEREAEAERAKAEREAKKEQKRIEKEAAEQAAKEAKAEQKRLLQIEKDRVGAEAQVERDRRADEGKESSEIAARKLEDMKKAREELAAARKQLGETGGEIAARRKAEKKGRTGNSGVSV